ncbi:MAG: S24 family peptidase [Candidatus Binatia bacterium]
MTATKRQRETLDYLRDHTARFGHDPTLAIPEELAQAKNIFVLKVKGDSMTDEQFRDGDLILVQARSTVENRETVVALVDGETTIKKFYREDGGKIRLQSVDEKSKPIIANENQVETCGLVVAVIRKYQTSLNRGDQE